MSSQHAALSSRQVGRGRRVTRESAGLQDDVEQRSPAIRHGRSPFWERRSSRSTVGDDGSPAAFRDRASTQLSIYQEDDILLTASSGRGLKGFIAARRERSDSPMDDGRPSPRVQVSTHL